MLLRFALRVLSLGVGVFLKVLWLHVCCFGGSSGKQQGFPHAALHLILSRGRHWARAGLRGLCACQVQVEISESKELWYFFSSSFGWETGLGSAQYLLQYH